MSLNDIMRATDCRDHAFVFGDGNVGKGCSCPLRGSETFEFSLPTVTHVVSEVDNWDCRQEFALVSPWF